MDMEIQNKKENLLLERTEVTFTLSHPNQQTPKREAVRDLISKELKVPKERIIVDNLKPEFGTNNTRGYAKVYKNKELALQIERKHQLKRNKLITDQKQEKKAEVKKTEAEPKKTDAEKKEE